MGTESEPPFMMHRLDFTRGTVEEIDSRIPPTKEQRDWWASAYRNGLLNHYAKRYYEMVVEVEQLRAEIDRLKKESQ